MLTAVYGDSFAVAAAGRDSSGSWPSLLSQQFNLTNYAVSGSSLYYSFQRFLSTAQHYDRVIFLITNWGRLWLPQHQQQHLANVHTVIDHQTKLGNSPELQLARDYFLSLQVDHEAQTFHNLMVAEIARLRPDALLIPCFQHSMLCSPLASTMMDIQAIDLVHYKFDAALTPATELRHCHLNDENNKIFADKISSWLRAEPFELSVQDFVCPSAAVDYYFKLD